MRRLLRWTLAAAVSAIVLLAAAAGILYSRADVSTVGRLPFAEPLAIPPLLAPRVDGDGRKVFALELQAGKTELLPGRRAETWGANGTYLGPTLRASRGDRIVVNVRNDLPEETTLHWHGMHLPARADGNPHQPIEPGATWSPSWEIDQPAATLWYHPHLMGDTAEHVYRGVVGFFLLDDPQAEALDLPKTYGVDDIPLLIQDKRFKDDGSLDSSNRLIAPTGFLGDEILVNGTHDPYLDVTTERVRLRLLNGSNARIYNVGFADNRSFDLLASDGGLLEAPYRTDRIQLSPGERAEIVAAFEPGEQVVLRSFEPDLETYFLESRFAGGDDSFDLLEIRAAPTLSPSPEVPARLAAHEHLHKEDATRTRRFELQGSSQINGRSMDMSRIDEVIETGAAELWQVENASGTPHNFHVHGVSFRVVDYAGGDPPVHLAGPKDTVYVPPGEKVSLLVRFPDYPDADNPYMFHCHLLQHEDRGMMGQFVLVEPSQEPSERPHNHAGRGS